MNKALIWTAAGLVLMANLSCEEQPWQAHEWGTFTSLQDENGAAIGGINTDDEPVPAFVHRLNSFALLRPTEVPGIFFQGAPRCHPDVIMRLETPVIYFHLSKPSIHIVDVTAKFRGGWLTEFYPGATPQAPGLRTNDWFNFGHLNSDIESQLEWKGLRIGGHWPLTNTTAHVWTSPRAVRSASVQTSSGESEKFLFYRGVAHIDAPLRISRDANSGQLLFRSQWGDVPTDKSPVIPSLWLVNIHTGGNIAFRPLPSLTLDRDSKRILASTPADFAPNDFKTGNLEKLKAVLKAALISEGLFADEADALLNTWELSYFKSPGERVFFLVPRAWTDFYLPLAMSPVAEVSRVMVGRIELVSPKERAILKAFADFTPEQIQQERGQLFTNYYGRITFNFSTDRPRDEDVQQMHKALAQVEAGQISLSSFVAVPNTYQTYLSLGRFRNALILDEATRRPTPGLTNFIATYRLEAYQPVEVPPGI